MSSGNEGFEARFHPPQAVQEELLFRRMVGTEELGRLSSYDIDVLHRRPKATESDGASAIDADQMLGKTACVELVVEAVNDTRRYFHGYITHFERNGEEGAYDVYRLTLRPWLWYLSQTTDCKIFHRKSALEIIQEVFQEYGSEASFENKIQATLRKREFTVQYRETDFDFLSRLMESEGVYYYFTHEKESHTLVLCDGASTHPPIVGPHSALAWSAALAYEEDFGENANPEIGGVITRWRRTRSVQPVSYSHTDFDPEAPASDLSGTHQREASHGKLGKMDFFDYPGLHDDLAQTGDTGGKKEDGARLAKLKVAGFQAQSDVATAITGARAAAVGFQFSLTKHPDDSDDYLITHTEIQAEFGGYEGHAGGPSKGFRCRMEAIPRSNPFQPTGYTEQPMISGPQTAVVVGASGDEISTEKLGRVKVQFHWDRLGTNDQDSSCWVRVCQPWASNKFGFFALPRVGDEVVIEFLEGNPDRPIIVGSVYNGTNLPPYVMPDHATVSGIRSRSSKGGGEDNFNELRFEDKKGDENIWFQAEKDFNQLVKHDALVTVKNDATIQTEKNYQHKIGEKMTLDVGKVTTIHLGADTHAALDADCNLAIKGALNLKVDDATAVNLGQAMALTVGQALDVNVSQGTNLTANAAINVKGMSIVLDAGMTISLKAGPSFITIGPDGVTISGPMVKVNSGGSGSSASSAQSANPAAPQSPGDPATQTDPLAS